MASDPFSYAQQADLEIALGGAAVLVQLADFNKDGVADANVVADYLEGGAAEVRSAAEVKHDPETLANLDTPSLKRLIDANAGLSARIAYEKGGRGMAMPDWVRDRAERQDRFVERLARGEARLGRVAGSAGAVTTQASDTGVVDQDPNGDGGTYRSGAPASRISVAGLMRGFR